MPPLARRAGGGGGATVYDAWLPVMSDMLAVTGLFLSEHRRLADEYGIEAERLEP